GDAAHVPVRRAEPHGDDGRDRHAQRAARGQIRLSPPAARQRRTGRGRPVIPSMHLGLLRHPTDIPLDRDPAARTLPWIIPAIAFLATIALAGAILLNGVIVRWSNSLSGTLTIQIPAAATAEETESRLKRVVALLHEQQAI